MSEYRKVISVAALRTALEHLPDDQLLTPNSQGNLAVLDGGEYSGWIDFADGQVHRAVGDTHDARRFRQRRERAERKAGMRLLSV